MIFQSCGSWWPWDRHRNAPLFTTQVSVWPHLVSQTVVSLQGWGQIPSLCALGGSVLHLPTSQTIPTPSRTPHWPRCAHHCWDRRCTALAHSRAHQLGPFHLSGRGLRAAAPAQLHAGKLTRGSPSSSPCSQALPRLSKRHPGRNHPSSIVYFSNTNKRLKLIIDWGEQGHSLAGKGSGRDSNSKGPGEEGI